MRQYMGRIWSSCRARSFSSAAPNGCAHALRFSSSWAMSVILGMVVCTLGLRSTHLSAASMAPSRFNIERQIELTGQRKVPLPSGGEIVIDETEALIAIDVNTGSHKNRSGDEKNTLYAVNLEAAQEAARQIRLRNLGGLIILDFIDMKERRHRNAVYEKMVELMSSDKAKNHILPISQLGIMQMTRQRQQESLSSNLYTDCPYCRG